MGTCCRKVEGSERRRLGSFVICSLPSYHFSDGGHTTEALLSTLLWKVEVFYLKNIQGKLKVFCFEHSCFPEAHYRGTERCLPLTHFRGNLKMFTKKTIG